MAPIPVEVWDRITIGTVMLAGLLCATYIAKLVIIKWFDSNKVQKKRKK
jgi:hypothetical protein